MPDSMLEKVYYKLPVLVQNTIFSAYGWTLNKKRYNKSFYKQLDELKKMEWWSEQQIKDYQNKKFLEVINHAYTTVPFYKKWYDELGIDINDIHSIDDISKLPILTKQMAKANQEDLVSNIYDKSKLNKGLTSGTSGTPLSVYLTPEGLAMQWATWWRHKSRFNAETNSRHLTFGARVPIDQNQNKPPYWREDYANNRVYLSTYHISQETVKDIVDYLNSTEFEFYTGYPSAMYVLANLIEENNLSLKKLPKSIICGSDALLPKYEEVIGRVFGAPVTEQYGMVEFAGNMSKCEKGLFHVDFECGYIEGIAHPDNPDLHNLVMTNWGNPAMPFIRYEVGDYGLASNEACSCGRHSRTYLSIEGRLEDYIVTPDDRKIIGMNQVFEYATNAKEIQLVQTEKQSVTFKIVAGENFGDEDKKALIREFSRRGGNDMTINFEIVDELERSATGKIKAVISNLGKVS